MVEKMGENCTIINTDALVKPVAGDDLYTSRANFYKHVAQGAPEASICIQAFNRLEKTKKCIEYVLEYTKEINYELILIDSGSDDGTFEFFQSVEHANKKIIKITKNMGINFAFPYMLQTYTSNFLAVVPNDVYVTKNWLSNLLACVHSDDRIGMVCPCSTNVSNIQSCASFTFTTLEEMQAEAEKFNVSDNLKWEQRMRLIPLVGIYRREALDLAGISDSGFFHDFSEDDWCIRFRRAGFKLMLCGDTMVHHDHYLAERDAAANNESLSAGRQNYRDKYFGLDAWNDVINFEMEALSLLQGCEVDSLAPRILGVDVKMGTPILEICNILRKNNTPTTRTSAFTTHAKYYLELQTICSGDVFCDRIDYIDDYFQQGEFDFVFLGEPINLYANPIKLLKKLLEITRMGGRLFVKLRNIGDMRAFLFSLGQQCADEDMPVAISLFDFISVVKSLNVNDYQLTVEGHNVDADGIALLRDAVFKTGLTAGTDDVVNNMQIKNFILCIEK